MASPKARRISAIPKIATQLMFRATGVAFFKDASYLLLVLLYAVIALLLAFIARNAICTPEQ